MVSIGDFIDSSPGVSRKPGESRLTIPTAVIARLPLQLQSPVTFRKSSRQLLCMGF